MARPQQCKSRRSLHKTRCFEADLGLATRNDRADRLARDHPALALDPISDAQTLKQLGGDVDATCAVRIRDRRRRQLTVCWAANNPATAPPTSPTYDALARLTNTWLDNGSSTHGYQFDPASNLEVGRAGTV